ncbi:hypothetical protein I7636_01875 [Mycoplasma mycoides subsp. capri]|uniref:hypothetical protein n=1 Tax=Mycoplasma mycoides TaxID=2102 RepID=UPI00223F2C9E|nr:hypothetical protein [Mycoplasma mycoides]QVK02333.1 hypothetical protein I7636_01875 [Mycoplasma mycoides subsp. capri]
MKKILSILTSLTVLTSSLLIISCSNNITNMKYDKKQKDIKKEDNDSKDEKNKSIDNNKTIIDNDSFKSDHNKKQPESKEEKISPDIKQKIQEIQKNVDSKQEHLIKNLTSEIVHKYLWNSFVKQTDKKLLELNNKILKLFNESKIDDIKIEINTLLSESFSVNQKIIEKEKQEITDLLKDIKIENKEQIIAKINSLLIKISTNKFNKEQQQLTNEINKLLSQKQYEQVKRKLIDLISFSVDLKMDKASFIE